MDRICVGLTVYFENPFWAGIFEVSAKGAVSASKVTFGAEPKDFEVYEFILKHYYDLQFSPPVETEQKSAVRNPKRLQREIKRQLCSGKTGTKSHQALKLQQEQTKQLRREKKREKKCEKSRILFEMRQQKKHQKHRGH